MGYLPAVEIFGAFFNRVRGGWFDGADQNEGGYFLSRGKLINVIAFALMVWICSRSIIMGLASGLGMYVGQSFGVGRYIGAINGTERRPLEEVKFIDWLIYPLRPKGTPMFVANINDEQFYKYPSNRLIAWGLAGLSLRGFLWAMCIALPVLVFTTSNGENYFKPAMIFVITGSAMGIIYASALHAFRYHPLVKNGDGVGWQAGEFYFGAILWGSFTVNFLQ